MNFYQWLETRSRSNVQFANFGKDGRVSVFVGDQKYVYLTDAGNHYRWELYAKKSPEWVLNQIRRHVAVGAAKQIEPELTRVQPVDQHGDDSCPTCRTPAPHYHAGIECPGCMN